MKKIKTIMLMAALAIPAIANATDYPWLTFRMIDDTDFSVSSDSLDINYKDGYLHLSSSSIARSIPVEQIKSMRFTPSPAGVDTMPDFQSAEAYYYNLSGIPVGRFNSKEEASKVLPSGMYIVKTNSKTFKIALCPL